MMSRDFFLLNRGYQIARLCSASQGPRFVLPPAKLRSRLPAQLADFYALIERILSWLQAGHSDVSSQSETQLQAAQRRDLENFERIIVVHRFSAEESVKQPAVDLIRAIFADAEYFSGLKPLPQYTDAFAYELLFPSWLNLLKATMLPRADTGKARLEGKRQGVLFEFLGKLATPAVADENTLAGYMTFVASRFDAPHCENLLQRLVDLYLLKGQRLMQGLESIDLYSKDARELKLHLATYLVVCCSLEPCTDDSRYSIAYKRPSRRSLPAPLAQALTELEDSQDWAAFFAIAHPLAKLIESEHSITPELSSLFSAYPSEAARLLTLIVPPLSDEAARVLSSEGQVCLALLLKLQPELLHNSLDKLLTFAHGMAGRLEGYSETVIRYFCRILIEDEEGRTSLLTSCASLERRQQLAERLLARAGKTDDDGRFLNLLSCVTIVSPDACMLEAKNTLRALEAVISNRSIGTKELQDLLSDLRANCSQSLQYLASPMLAAANKNPRLAVLYLTLNEVSQKYAEVGSVDNFSVLRAKFAKLTSMGFD